MLKILPHYIPVPQSNFTILHLMLLQNNKSQVKPYILPVIVMAQFFCTSLWFAGNAVISDITAQLHISTAYLAHLTSAVQLGFILGTLVFAVLSIADRFSPSKVFFCCAIIAGLFNLGIVADSLSVVQLFTFRFGTGFFLAGIYPVGMKIVADYDQQKLGKSLGFLVGALVLGTAFPHLLKSLGGLPWQLIIYCTTALSLIGGLAIFTLVPDGPNRTASQKPKLAAFLSAFKYPRFKAAAFGYFGHMWELYAFWVFVPLMLTTFKAQHNANYNISLWTFIIIMLGSFSCVGSGLISIKYGTKRIASLALLISTCCCICSPLLLMSNSMPVFIAFLMIWSIAVIADSPLFSTLVAQNAPSQYKGAALTIVNCIGFTVTIISIQLINVLQNYVSSSYVYVFLSIGPILGLYALAQGDKTTNL
eukprot:Opistho-1_new@81677